jgi:integrase
VSRAFLRNLITYIKLSDDFSKDIKDIVGFIEIPKVTGAKRRRELEVINETQLYDIVNAMTNERNRIMLLLTFYGGLRVSELCSDKYGIKPYSFNWNTWVKDPSKEGVLKVVGKRNKQRTVYIPQQIMSRVYQWIRNVAKKLSKDSKLFKISHIRWRKIIYESSHKALGFRIHPHTIRHSCATWLRGNNWTIDEIKEYLGHEFISTTMIYFHSNPENLRLKFSEIVQK